MKINRPLKLKNHVLKYAWGSHTAIQHLLNVDFTEEPWAEVWMGAHPKAPSEVCFEDQWISLPDFIRRYPDQILGAKTAARYNNTLPYLFKLLAAEQPLSIQAHPSADQAKIGFKKESAAGTDINASTRNYKDTNHKPECICALSPFTGLKGFRKIDDAVERITSLCPVGLAQEIKALFQKDLKRFFKSLMELSDTRKKTVINEVMRNIEKRKSSDLTCEWIQKLYHRYPSDIGVISPLFLNLFRLKPGQALFLPAGELHAYLDGFGIELMANSDNVLRGGLTPKHVDVPELINVLNFVETDIEILKPESISSAEARYPVFADEFQLSAIKVSDNRPYFSPNHHSAEILLCINGHANLTAGADGGACTDMKQGDSVLIPAAAEAYQVTGSAECYKAGIPL